VLDLACLSPRYLIHKLQERCTEYCAANVSLISAVPWLIAADANAIAGLRNTLLEYVAANLPGIEAAVPDTRSILEAHPALLYDVAMLGLTSPTPRPTKRRKTGG
jgi:hypothetical protein